MLGAALGAVAAGAGSTDGRMTARWSGTAGVAFTTTGSSFGPDHTLVWDRSQRVLRGAEEATARWGSEFPEAWLVQRLCAVDELQPEWKVTKPPGLFGEPGTFFEAMPVIDSAAVHIRERDENFEAWVRESDGAVNAFWAGRRPRDPLNRAEAVEAAVWSLDHAQAVEGRYDISSASHETATTAAACAVFATLGLEGVVRTSIPRPSVLRFELEMGRNGVASLTWDRLARKLTTSNVPYSGDGSTFEHWFSVYTGIDGFRRPLGVADPNSKFAFDLEGRAGFETFYPGQESTAPVRAVAIPSFAGVQVSVTPQDHPLARHAVEGAVWGLLNHAEAVKLYPGGPVESAASDALAWVSGREVGATAVDEVTGDGVEVSAAETAAAAELPSAPQPVEAVWRLVADSDGCRLYTPGREAAPVVRGLSANWAWSRAQRFWYQPRTLRPETLADNLVRTVGGLERQGVAVAVDYQLVPGSEVDRSTRAQWRIRHSDLPFLGGVDELQPEDAGVSAGSPSDVETRADVEPIGLDSDSGVAPGDDVTARGPQHEAASEVTPGYPWIPFRSVGASLVDREVALVAAVGKATWWVTHRDRSGWLGGVVKDSEGRRFSAIHESELKETAGREWWTGVHFDSMKLGSVPALEGWAMLTSTADAGDIAAIVGDAIEAGAANAGVDPDEALSRVSEAIDVTADSVTTDDVVAACHATVPEIAGAVLDDAIGRWRPPTGPKSRAAANLAVMDLLVKSRETELSEDERAHLGAWSGWGACADIFDESDDSWAPLRDRAKSFMTDGEWKSARRSVLNAHYTDPTLVEAMTDLVGEAMSGVDRRLRVLEPGCGSGNFLDPRAWPIEVDAVGVELDAVTARVAALSYPDALVRSEGFEDTNLPDGSFDITIGNVPFGNYRLHDPRHNRGKHSIHNHFIIKALELTAPGGMVAVLTSRYTLDATNPAARREMWALGDLVGVVRTAEGAHTETAGTGVVTDLLVFRRRHEGEPRQAFVWEHTEHRPDLLLEADRTAGEAGPSVNAAFRQRGHHRAETPDRTSPLVVVAGTEGVASGRFDRFDLSIKSASPVSDAAAAIRQVRERVRQWTFDPALRVAGDVDFRKPVKREREGSIRWLDDPSRFERVEAGSWVVWNPRSRPDEVRLLCGVRDALLATLEAQAASDDDAAFSAQQRELNLAYDTYVHKYGPINRFTVSRTGRRINPPMGGFRNDPDFAVLRACEHFDDSTQQSRKTAIFDRRVLKRRTERTTAETPGDAISIALDMEGVVNLATVASLLGVSEDDAERMSGDLLWRDPDSGRVVTADEYLSGNVRSKLAAARLAAETDPSFGRHVTALEAVMPVDLGPDEIHAQMGAVWIPPSVYTAFLVEHGINHAAVSWSESSGKWSVRAPVVSADARSRVSAWTTQSFRLDSAVEAALTGRPVRITKRVGESTVTDEVATAAAQEAVENMRTAFSEWVFADEARARPLVERYNEMFNSTVERTFDGSHLTLPGLSEAIKPHKHQLDAVWRMLQEDTTMLDHAVGAGKTGEMVMAAMEMRRLDPTQQPWLVVPNHMLEQVARETLEWYPGAKILIADKERMATEAGRREFVARSATEDYDLVVITGSTFERIPMSAETWEAYVAAELGPLQAELATAEGRSVKAIETRIATLETKLKERRADARRDDGLLFEQTGCTRLFVDEAHKYKNLACVSALPGIGVDGSARATDLHVKLSSLRRRFGPKVAVFATGTPIANSMVEAWTMERFLRPEALTAAGCERLDRWLSTFATTAPRMEMRPSGSGWRVVTGINQFMNVPELVSRFRAFADVRLASDLGLATPDVVGGSAETVVIDRDPAIGAFIADLESRYSQVIAKAVKPDEDNVLKIVHEGTMVALDPRTVGLPPPANGGKVTAIAERAARIWEETKDREFSDGFGDVSARRGTLQVVFCDRSIPGQGWNFYEALRGELYALGLPEGSVRFIHEASNDAEKARLFRECRDGKVSVLIGSTEKMGVGTNIQRRLVALHHADCPWRPADLEQREGRILRQGNENAEVHVNRYVTEGTFDAYRWGKCEMKAGFIAQIQQGTVSGRTMEDVSEQALSFAEVKALASGNPIAIERASLAQSVQRLELLDHAHRREQTGKRHEIAGYLMSIPELESSVAAMERLIAGSRSTSGDQFAMTIDGERFSERKAAGDVLAAKLGPQPSGAMSSCAVEVGGVTLTGKSDEFRCAVTIDGLPGVRALVLHEENVEGLGLARRVENLVGGLPARLESDTALLAKKREYLALAEATVGAPFAKADDLARMRTRLREIDAELAAEAKGVPVADNPVSVDTDEETVVPVARAEAPGVPVRV